MNERYLLLILALPCMAHAAGSLCTPGEKTYFACPSARHAKMISLCGAAGSDEGVIYLQYRYGTADKVELEFPASKEGSTEKFRYAHYSRYRNDRTQVSFSNGGFSYSIFTDYDGEGGKHVEEQGVLVADDNRPGKEARILCRQPAKEVLSQLENVLACDEENALASCK